MNLGLMLLGAIQAVNAQNLGQNTIVIPPKCGGPNKIQCPNGLDCVFAPSQISDPNAGGFCVFPGTPVNSALFNLPTGVATSIAVPTAISSATSAGSASGSTPTNSVGYQSTIATQTTAAGTQVSFGIAALGCLLVLL
ncbi:hypothetical protein HK103_005657 [Boothiomyces macroporosus]|uniref:Uncharacterized protein n=1 Tax=Boothiomyces macroporosus TaxID=261099 RepID=A0AAD5Y796_9FUNG|nr:hypothetical protein HK103_005657 [Boothiomyces macroporosus]